MALAASHNDVSTLASGVTLGLEADQWVLRIPNRLIAIDVSPAKLDDALGSGVTGAFLASDPDIVRRVREATGPRDAINEAFDRLDRGEVIRASS